MFPKLLTGYIRQICLQKVQIAIKHIPRNETGAVKGGGGAVLRLGPHARQTVVF